MLQDCISLDLMQDSNREMITENRMAVKNCELTSEAINDYLGREIKSYGSYNLEPDKVYKVYRPRKELEKAIHQYNGLDLVDDHHPINGEKKNRHLTIGATGESATIDNAGKVLNTLFITDKSAIKDIELASKTNNQIGKRQLSCSYDYTPVFEKGVFNNKPYDLWIKDLKLDHVALVKEGRVANAMIADSNINLKGKNSMKEFIKSALKGIFGLETINDSQIEQVMLLNDAAKDNDPAEKKYEVKDTEHKKVEDSESEKEKDKEELERIKKMEKHEKEELKAKDKDCMAKDEEKDKECREKEIKDAVNSELKERIAVQNLCTQVIGKLSDSALALDKETLINDALKVKGLNIDNKSYEIKKAMLEAIAQTSQVHSNGKIKQFNDAKHSSSKFKYSAEDIKKLTGAK